MEKLAIIHTEEWVDACGYEVCITTIDDGINRTQGIGANGRIAMIDALRNLVNNRHIEED